MKLLGDLPSYLFKMHILLLLILLLLLHLLPIALRPFQFGLGFLYN